MAFELRHVAVLSYTNGHTMWVYNSRGSTLADIQAAGFFSDAKDMLSQGDVILVTGTWGATFRVVSGLGPEVTTSSLIL